MASRPASSPPRHAASPRPGASPSEAAENPLLDPEVARLLGERGRREVQRTRQVFVNRNLRMDRVEMVGFDMDYTLAIYHMRRVEELSFRMTLDKLVKESGYPAVVGAIRYEHAFVMRGLVVDREAGNLFKMDRYNHVGRAYHGRTLLDSEEWKRLYRDEKIKLSTERYAWIDTLFALPEACLFAEIIETMEGARLEVDYGKLYDDIRYAIDTVHRDGSLKAEIKKDVGAFIYKDPELGPMLHKLRSGGKKLFLLTNSFYDYTDTVMRFLLDGVLPEYPSWRNYFDDVVVGASKPGFFSDLKPFLEVDPATGEATLPAHTLDRGKVYQGGNLVEFERLAGIGGERILYVGDHIYGDILRSKKSSLWRTCMVIQELEDEVAYTERHAEDLRHLADLEVLRARLDDEVNQRKLSLNLLDRKLDKDELTPAAAKQVEEERRHAKLELEKLRRALKEVTGQADHLEAELERGANPYWGLLFKEGVENSRFGEQVEQYACLYTSRASNLLQYSPMHYFRSPRDTMPHEGIGGPNGKGAYPILFGAEGPPKGAQAG